MKLKINIKTLENTNTLRIHNTVYTNDKVRLDSFLKKANITFKDFLSDVLDSIDEQYSKPQNINKKGEKHGQVRSSL